MGDEIGPRTIAASFTWWCANRLSRLLEPAERSIVLGVLVEARAGGAPALREIGGLVGRRQAALWLAWQPWVALLLVAVPLGVMLSFVTRWWADYNVVLLLPYLRRGLSWTLLENQGIRNDAIEVGLGVIADVLSLLAWSWTCGYALGVLSRRTRWLTGTVVAVLVFTAAIGTMATTRTVGPDIIFSTVFVGTLFPLLVRTVFVLLPLEWGLQTGARPVSLRPGPALGLMCAVVALTAFEARGIEGALTFGAGILPAPGPDGFVGSLDDGRRWWWVPIVMAMPAMYMAATVLRQRQRGAVQDGLARGSS
jgi:hypothetical protein